MNDRSCNFGIKVFKSSKADDVGSIERASQPASEHFQGYRLWLIVNYTKELHQRVAPKPGHQSSVCSAIGSATLATCKLFLGAGLGWAGRQLLSLMSGRLMSARARLK